MAATLQTSRRFVVSTFTGVLVTCLLWIGTLTSHAANVWDGGGANANWDTVANWDDDLLPANAATVTIGAGFASGTTIDLNGDRTVAALSINSTTSFNLNDNTLTITSGNLSREGSGGGSTINVNSNIVLGTNGSWNISAPNTTLNFNGVISDGGNNFGIHFTPGANRSVTLAGNNTFDGDLEVTNTNVTISGNNSARGGSNIINSGSIRLAHADALGSGDLVFTGGSLQLGIASNVTLGNAWQITPGGTFGYSGNTGGTVFTMNGALAPLAGDVTLVAVQGGGNSRGIVIESNVTETSPSSLIISGGSNGTSPRFNGDISISGDIIVRGTGGQIPKITLAGDNSGSTGDLIVDSSVSTAHIQLLSADALTSGTFVIDGAVGRTSLQDDNSTTVKTYQGALRWGGLIGLDQENMKFTGNMLMTNDLVFQTGPANGILELAGNISDGGNGYGINMDPDNTRSGRLILSGTNNFSGGLIAEGGATSGNAIVQLDGSLSSGDITLGVRGTLEGTGTIFFQTGDTIEVDGTLDASDLTFDLTGHHYGFYTIVDYADGTFTGPVSAMINDLLNEESILLGWSLTDTGTEITAFRDMPPVPEPGTLALLGLGMIVGVSRRSTRGKSSASEKN